MGESNALEKVSSLLIDKHKCASSTNYSIKLEIFQKHYTPIHRSLIHQHC